MIVGNPAAYVFLKKHGPLIREVKNGGLLLTLEGRVFVIHYFFYIDYLTKKQFNDITEQGDGKENPLAIAMQTGQLIREAAEKWLKAVDEFAKKNPEVIVDGTDLNYRQMGALLWVLIASELKSETAAGWKANTSR
jgi:hypothetical protein